MVPAVLTIAGSDSGAGAGLQADIRTLAAHGVHGATAVTAVTAQNTRSVTAVDPVSPRMVAAQICAVFDDFEIAAVKTGMLATAAIVEAVCEALEAQPGPPLVVDPVIAATSGRRLLDEDGVRVMGDRLLRRARVVTPNRFEAEVLAGQPVASLDDARRAAARIRARGAAAAIVTGGHFDTDESVDVLDDGGAGHRLAPQPYHLRSERHDAVLGRRALRWPAASGSRWRRRPRRTARPSSRRPGSSFPRRTAGCGGRPRASTATRCSSCRRRPFLPCGPL